MSFPLTTTLAKIRAHTPCVPGWRDLLRLLGKTKADDAPLLLEMIVDSHGVEDAIWCLRTVDATHRQARLFAVTCARRVQRLMRDSRSIAALDVAERYANGQASSYELCIASISAGHAISSDNSFAARRAATSAVGASMFSDFDAAVFAADSAAAACATTEAELAWQAEEFRRLCRGEGQYA